MSIAGADWATVPLVHLPYFLPDDWSGGIERRGRRRAAIGRTWPRPDGW